MKMRKRILAALMAATMAAAALAGCGGGGNGESDGNSKKADGDAEGKKVLNYSYNSVVVGLNPILNTTAPDNRAHNMLSEPLLRDRTAEGNTSEVVGGCAETWEVSEDGLTWTFKFRKNGKWSDGEPLTAKDFEYTLKLMADPEVAATNAWLYDGIITGYNEALYEGADPNAIGVTATDDLTLEIKLVHTAAYLPELVASLYPVRQDKYEEWADEYGASPEKTLYSGPFTVESWNQNTEMILIKNDNYWNAENVGIDQIDYKVIQENATAVQAYVNGELDIISTSDENWGKQIEAEGNSEKFTVPDGSPEFIMFNTANEYLQNVKIRQALSCSFDRQEMIDVLLNGMAHPNYSVIPDTMKIGEKTYTELVNGENYLVKKLQEENADPKKLLEEGLAELGKDTDPSKVTIRYASRGTNEFSKKTAEWLKQTWEENLGITVQIDMMEWNIMWEKIDAGDYDIASGGWGPYYNEPSAILSLFEPDNGNFNAEKTGWKDADAAKFKELLEQAKKTVDEQELAEIYLQAEQLLVGNAIVAPEHQTMAPSYIAKHVKGYYVSTTGNVDWSQVTVE